MSNYRCNSRAMWLPSQNLATVPQVLPFSIKVGALRARSMSDNNIFVL